MHEVSVAETILKAVLESAEQNNVSYIKEVAIRVGALSGVEPTSLGFALDCLKADTIAEKAEFLIKVIPAVGVCHECQRESHPDTFFSICEHCGSPALEIKAGEELDIEYMDVED